MVKPRVKQTKLSGLRPHEDNPRGITAARLEELKASLVADELMLEARPLVALPDGRVICGNQRLAAAEALGWITIPCMTVDLDEETALLWMLRDNQGYGDWVFSQVRDLVDGLGDTLPLTGFSSEELDAILKPTHERGWGRGMDDCPELPTSARSKLGVVYELGPHRVMCGDASDAKHVAKLLDGASVDCVWTDPPYGAGYVGGANTDARAVIAGDTGSSLEDLLMGALGLASAATVPGGAWYVCSSAGPTEAIFETVLAHYGMRRWQLVWVKNHAPMGRMDYHAKHEVVFYGWKAGASRSWFGGRKQTTVLEYDKPSRSQEHPTMKPVAMIDQCLRNSTARGAVVYDPFAGSGSTLVAAGEIDRRCLAMELEPAYVDVIRDRWEALQ